MRKRAIIIAGNDVEMNLIDNILKNREYEIVVSPEPIFCPIYLNSEYPCPVDTFCATIIIADISMPSIFNVLGFIENLKRNGCKVQNIATMSGRWTYEKFEHAKRLGCHIFKKSFKIDEIERWLDACEKKLDPNSKLSDLPRRIE
jgi:hypothetical protein